MRARWVVPPAVARQGASPLGHAGASLARAGPFGLAQRVHGVRSLHHGRPGHDERALTDSIFACT
eukprot:13231968-Alexandrium_andersonii.AAC.1